MLFPDFDGIAKIDHRPIDQCRTDCDIDKAVQIARERQKVHETSNANHGGNKEIIVNAIELGDLNRTLMRIDAVDGALYGPTERKAGFENTNNESYCNDQNNGWDDSSSKGVHDCIKKRSRMFSMKLSNEEQKIEPLKKKH